MKDALEHAETPAQVLAGLPDARRQAQATFERTGGLHALGLFDTAGNPARSIAKPAFSDILASREIRLVNLPCRTVWPGFTSLCTGQ